jgi:hypothetical protein
MIALTPEQAKALEGRPEPLEVQHPQTGESFVLIRKNVFEQMKAWAAPLNRGWDDPALDVYNEP